MKRWAAPQRGIRWTLGGVAAVGLAPAAARVLVPAGDWLAHQDGGPAGGPLPRMARDTAPGRVLALGAGLLATGALVLTVRRFALSRDGRVTDRYATARGQLGCEKLDVRIGGIHALERVARDSPADHPAVMEMLAAFIRERSREQWPSPDPGGQARQRSLRPDVRAAITAAGRRLTEREIGPVDLARADLTGADLTDADLTGADLAGADLTRAELTGALWPAGGPVPAGWDRHTGSGQLIPAGTGAETAQANQPRG